MLAHKAIYALAGSAAAENKAVILLYHRFGEDTFPSTSVREEQYRSHIEILKTQKYTVLPVLEILESLRHGRALPARTVGMTIDDGYRSFAEKAWPVFRQAGFPVTLFVSTHRSEISWRALARLQKQGVDIQPHGARHRHLPALSAEQQRAEIEDSIRELQTRLGIVPRLYSYSWGEATRHSVKILSENGISYAFGQHSGVVGAGAPSCFLPRFGMNERWGERQRFREITLMQALPVAQLRPAGPVLPPLRAPELHLRVPKQHPDINCHDGATGTPMRKHQRSEGMVSFQSPTPWENGQRVRVNCTSRRADGQWQWFGWQYVISESLADSSLDAGSAALCRPLRAPL